MEQLSLKATPRDLLGKKVKIMRGKGQIPGVVYGRKFESIPLILDKKEFSKVAGKAGEATIINLDISPRGKEVPQKEPIKALIRNIQKDPVNDEMLHVDFYKVDMKQEIQTEIPLEFIGISQAVEELEGNLITNKDSIKASCLPDKLVSKIEVDISALKTFEDLIHIKDLNVPEGIKVLDDAEDIVAQVTPPRSEEELEEMEKEAASEKEKAQIENIEATAEAEKAAKVEAKEGEEAPTETPTETPQEPEQPEKKNV